MVRKTIGKLHKESIIDQIYDILKEYIMTGEWEPGYKLPSENDLAVSFGVSRMSVRMVLQKLNALHLIETKVGEGTFVREFSFKNYIGEVSDIIVKNEMFDDIYEFRRDIEIRALKYAIERGTDADFEELEKCMDKLDKAHDIDEYLALDFAFHRQICKMSKNSLYVLTFEGVRGFIESYLKANVQKSVFSAGDLNLTKEFHGKLKDAIISRNFDLARDIYLEIIEYLNPQKL